MPLIEPLPAEEIVDPFTDAIDKAAAHFRARAEGYRWRNDPVGWAKKFIGQTLWSKQRDIADSIVNNKRTAVKSGHGVGKTHIAAILTQWWIETHIGEEVMVVTTAPSVDQVEGVLWEYIRKSHMKYKLSGTITENAKWKDDNRNLIGIGRKPADGNTTSFQGRHYKYTLVIIDEACGIASELFTAVDAIATTDTCRVLAIGNPTDPNTPFGNIFLGNGGRGLDAWNKLTISVLDNPNFTDEEFPNDLKAQLSSRQWVADKTAEVGLDSMDYKSRVLGDFPESSEDSMYPIHLLYKATDTVIDPPPDAHNWFGVDIAKYGSDKCALVHNRGGKLEVLDVWGNSSGKDSAYRIHNWAVEKGVTEVRIDQGGGGDTVEEFILPLATNFYAVVMVVGSAASPNNEKWLNYRAYMHDMSKQQMMHGQLSLPSVLGNPMAQQLFNELTLIKYKMNLTYGSLQIESKEEMRRKGVKSPDIADAMNYACLPSVIDQPLASYRPGDVVEMDAFDVVFDEFEFRGYAISPM